MAYRLVRSRRTFFHALFYTLFPIDLNQTAYRLVMRIPSLYFLYRATALLFVVLLQEYGMFPSEWITSLRPVAEWASHKTMEEVCWSVFGAVCLALIIGALSRGLEGVGTNNASPFNLVSSTPFRIVVIVEFTLPQYGYAMLLHIYAAPIAHTNKGHVGQLSRPDKNALVTLFLPLFQVLRAIFYVVA